MLAISFHKYFPHIPNPSPVCLEESYFSGSLISTIHSLHFSLIHIVSLKVGKEDKNEFIPVLSAGPHKRH